MAIRAALQCTRGPARSQQAASWAVHVHQAGVADVADARLGDGTARGKRHPLGGFFGDGTSPCRITWPWACRCQGDAPSHGPPGQVVGDPLKRPGCAAAGGRATFTIAMMLDHDDPLTDADGEVVGTGRGKCPSGPGGVQEATDGRWRRTHWPQDRGHQPCLAGQLRPADPGHGSDLLGHGCG